MLDTGVLLEYAETEGRALASAAARSPHAPLPSCPGWRMSDLIAHAGVFASQFLGRMDGAPTNGPWPEDVPDTAERLTWFADAHAELLATLRSNHAAAWAEDRPAPWLSPRALRRWTHELAVHRWDAEFALGDARPIPAVLAADGVEEMIERFLTPPFWRSPRSDRRLRLNAGEVAWTLRFDGEGVSWTGSPEEAHAEVRGSASDIDLFLWGRRRIDDLAASGDLRVIDLLKGAPA